MRVTTAGPHRPPFDQSRIGDLTWPWTHVEVLPEAGSTNALLADRARAGEEEGLVVVADHQTSGRGRLDRTWETPPRAALTFSVLLRPARMPADRWPWLPLLTGVAVAETVAARGDVDCSLKWPNDVMAGDRKLGGLLVERVDTPQGAAAVVGIGLNVTTTADALPVPTATSLLLEGADPAGLRREDLLREVLVRLGRRYHQWCAPGARGSTELAAAYRGLCGTVGRRVEVHLPGGGVRAGTAEAVEDDGALRVRTATGPLVVHSGDVVHVRAVAPGA